MALSRRALGLLAALAALAPAFDAARAQTALEQQVKAAFVSKFPAFVSWPPAALSPGEPLRLCILGDGGAARAVEQAAGRALGDRAVVVRQVTAVESGDGCHLLYAAGSTRQTPAEALQAMRGWPVLTVTDSTKGAARGMIHFVIFQDRVRFHIDAAQAAQNGLAMNSKLLALGLSVRR